MNRQGVVEAYQTFRGNEWDNKGERLGAGVDVNVNVRVLTEKNFYESRGGCEYHLVQKGLQDTCQRAQGLTRLSTPVSLLGLLKNPMILIGIFGMGMMIGMPYLLDNSTSFLTLADHHITRAPTNFVTVDPEMKKEFEEQQKSSPLAGVTSGGGPMQGFDMAAWMAGKTAPSSSTEEKSVEASKPKSKKRG